MTCNLGDSGYMLLREVNNELGIVYESKEQQHGFNFPYQIGTNGDDPRSADTNAHKVENHDIVILGSDGLWDNFHKARILDVIKPHLKASEDGSIKDKVEQLSIEIAQLAEQYSYRHAYMSPFAESARAHNFDYIGGKPDDITVIVAQILLK